MLLDILPDYRVLRRVTPLVRRGAHDRSSLMVGCALDVETTGLDHRADRVIELAMQRFLVGPDGSIVETGLPRRWLEDPGRPLPPEITRITGLVDADVSGRAIQDAEATSILNDVDFVVAHNAAFDRKFVERRLPDAVGRPWCCSIADVDWRGHGFEGTSLSHLLLQAGWFYRAHRASDDVDALIRLLDHRFDDGATVVSGMIATARQETWRLEAVGAPFAAKDLLKARGYRWDPAARLWWREIAKRELETETDWAAAAIYDGLGALRCRPIDWTRRFSERASGQ